MIYHLKGLTFWNTCQVCVVEPESVIKSILSIYVCSIYGFVCLQLAQFSCDDHESVDFILLSQSNGEYEPITIVYGYVMKQWCAIYVLLCSYGEW